MIVGRLVYGTWFCTTALVSCLSVVTSLSRVTSYYVPGARVRLCGTVQYVGKFISESDEQQTSLSPAHEFSFWDLEARGGDLETQTRTPVNMIHEAKLVLAAGTSWLHEESIVSWVRSY